MLNLSKGTTFKNIFTVTVFSKYIESPLSIIQWDEWIDIPNNEHEAGYPKKIFE